uniref:Uncharacterized protein n=1 Tax=Anopheles darlingi TaxID=43151 RepID=A0A2M4D8M2_ANODA
MSFLSMILSFSFVSRCFSSCLISLIILTIVHLSSHSRPLPFYLSPSPFLAYFRFFLFLMLFACFYFNCLLFCFSDPILI